MTWKFAILPKFNSSDHYNSKLYNAGYNHQNGEATSKSNQIYAFHRIARNPTTRPSLKWHHPKYRPTHHQRHEECFSTRSERHSERWKYSANSANISHRKGINYFAGHWGKSWKRIGRDSALHKASTTQISTASLVTKFIKICIKFVRHKCNQSCRIRNSYTARWTWIQS